MAMLKRDDGPVPATPASDLNALLGRGSEFEGKLTFEGTVRIDGKFTGTIVTNDTLVVGEGAKVSAEITCGTIIVHGEITGNVRAKNAVEYPDNLGRRLAVAWGLALAFLVLFVSVSAASHTPAWTRAWKFFGARFDAVT